VIPREVTRLNGRGHGQPARRGGRKRPRDSRRSRNGSSALAPCGARRAAAHVMPRAPPVPRRPPLRPPSTPAWERPSSRRSSLEPTKITVKSASAYGLRVLRMALRATLDCDLRATHDRAYRKDGRGWAADCTWLFRRWSPAMLATTSGPVLHYVNPQLPQILTGLLSPPSARQNRISP
jgi:hypothetical protein